MRVLLLAPQPFYTERGTPIAVRCLLTELSRCGWTVDVLTFPEGLDVEIPNVRIIRTGRLPGVADIGPGFSVKKAAYDLLLFFKALRLAARGGYRYVHAVEEAAFMAAVIRWLFRVPYVYDMDSSIAEQIVEKRPSLSFLLPVLKPLEAATLRRAAVVVPVCEALERIASSAGASHTIVLTDPPVFSVPCHADAAAVRRQIGLPGPVFMYVGNLEVYQGVGLLLEAFATAARHGCQASLVVVGGKPADVAAHQVMAASLGIDDRTRFLGPKPLLETGALVGGADVLVSPRITGVNTPMKIYAYLNAGKPILATDIESHSQVLTDQIAVLAPPSSERLAEAICRLANDPDLRRQLGERAARVAREKYSQDAFAATVRRLCQLIESQTAA